MLLKNSIEQSILKNNIYEVKLYIDFNVSKRVATLMKLENYGVCLCESLALVRPIS